MKPSTLIVGLDLRHPVAPIRRSGDADKSAGWVVGIRSHQRVTSGARRLVAYHRSMGVHSACDFSLSPYQEKSVPPDPSNWISFRNEQLKRRYSNSRIPMNTLVESYLDEKLDIECDLQELMRNKDLFVNYRLTFDQAKFFFQKFIPSVIQHTKKVDRKLVTDHYDRGNDFFEAFLGEVMVYTSAVFKSREDKVETAQRQKLDYVAGKLQLKPNERLLDVGCGWGTLVTHMAERYGVGGTRGTLCKNQAELGSKRIAEKKLSWRARILALDYRDIPPAKYDKISVLEMAEHVGIKQFQKFFRQLSAFPPHQSPLHPI